MQALVIPKAIIKERIAEWDDILKLLEANCGIIVLSIPIIPPTKAFTINSKIN